MALLNQLALNIQKTVYIIENKTLRIVSDAKNQYGMV